MTLRGMRGVIRRTQAAISSEAVGWVWGTGDQTLEWEGQTQGRRDIKAALTWVGGGVDAGKGCGAVRWGGVSVIETALSGIDGDNLAATSTDQEDPVETLSEDLQEFHVWERRVKETRGGRYTVSVIKSNVLLMSGQSFTYIMFLYIIMTGL